MNLNIFSLKLTFFFPYILTVLIYIYTFTLAQINLLIIPWKFPKTTNSFARIYNLLSVPVRLLCGEPEYEEAFVAMALKELANDNHSISIIQKKRPLPSDLSTETSSDVPSQQKKRKVNKKQDVGDLQGKSISEDRMVIADEQISSGNISSASFVPIALYFYSQPFPVALVPCMPVLFPMSSPYRAIEASHTRRNLRAPYPSIFFHPKPLAKQPSSLSEDLAIQQIMDDTMPKIGNLSDNSNNSI